MSANRGSPPTAHANHEAHDWKIMMKYAGGRFVCCWCQHAESPGACQAEVGIYLVKAVVGRDGGVGRGCLGSAQAFPVITLLFLPQTANTLIVVCGYKPRMPAPHQSPNTHTHTHFFSKQRALSIKKKKSQKSMLPHDLKYCVSDVFTNTAHIKGTCSCADAAECRGFLQQ